MTFLKNIPPHPGTPDPADDQVLIAAYKQTQDLRVLAQLYQQYLDLLYGVCLKYLAEPETAKDAVMDLFEELAQKLLRHEVTHFKGWLYTLAKNHCLMKLRSSGRSKTNPSTLILCKRPKNCIYMTNTKKRNSSTGWKPAYREPSSRPADNHPAVLPGKQILQRDRNSHRDRME